MFCLILSKLIRGNDALCLTTSLCCSLELREKKKSAAFFCVKKCVWFSCNAMQCETMHACACIYHNQDRCSRSIDSSSVRWHLSKKVSHHVISFTYNCSRKLYLVIHVQGPLVILSHEMANYSAKKQYQQRTTWKWTAVHLPRNAIILQNNEAVWSPGLMNRITILINLFCQVHVLWHFLCNQLNDNISMGIKNIENEYKTNINKVLS